MNKRPRITAEEKQFIAERFTQGMSIVAIANEMNRDPQAVRGHARAMGLDVPTINYVTEDARTKIAELYHQGKSDASIAHELGYGESTVRGERLLMELRRKKSSASLKKLRRKLITGAWV